MRFRFRLDPLLKIADRKRKTLRSELATVVSRRQTVEQMIADHVAETKSLEHTLSQAQGGREAVFFFHRRQARNNQLDLLRQRLQEFLNLEEMIEKEIVELNYEIHRLELTKEKARAAFKRELIKQEDKELDEIATLRYRAE